MESVNHIIKEAVLEICFIFIVLFSLLGFRSLIMYLFDEKKSYRVSGLGLTSNFMLV
jgi:hypothetical protein